MATYWVPDLPNIKGFSRQLWHSILIIYLLIVPPMHDPVIHVSLSLWPHLLFVGAENH